MKFLIILLVCVITVMCDPPVVCKKEEVLIAADDNDACEPVCKDFEKNVCLECPPRQPNISCFCKPGFARDDNKNCVPFKKCCKAPPPPPQR